MTAGSPDRARTESRRSPAAGSPLPDSRAVADHDDWRVTISLADGLHLGSTKRALAERQVARDVHRRLGARIAVSGDGSQVFLYAATGIAARQAEAVARAVLAEHGIGAELALDRWHPLAERWEDAATATPQTEAARHAEHEQLLADETAESLAAGIPQWEARAEFASHREAVALAGRLRQQGLAVVRRWRFLIVGASNEDEAGELADRLRNLAPGATVRSGHSGVFLPFIPF